ncbi:formate/nitrite transporter family protein [Vagococcus xieshaowenii]|uniref:Formate/nitrite transporter family protein n=1 Tax=Vagococcus xieshaowenii TaxID=2562451 RepID=A0AAJ5EFQ9_9ENTE|nr:formate/nitrite transporter family protein [Vagococcus xieshaowenii]QCA28784.1 formate/nitrite transporter family protein [Vagococcus xieshaowenii]TFZ43015.1 formate/nitrite transporter family protein [Vagococcus xieshaowenii]
MYSPDEVVELAIKSGVKKVNTSHRNKLILGFLAGAFVALGYIAYIKAVAALPHAYHSLVGGAVFPIGLICILLGAGELITSNMMTVSIAWYDKKVSGKDMLVNWVIVTFANLLGALFMAYFFGHILGLTEADPYLETTRELAHGKVDMPFLQAFVSGIGCNWMVGMAVWICYGAKDAAGKILGAWFPIMIFVLIGFQHNVANMFVIPAAIFNGGDITWLQMLQNFVPVYLGNLVGGTILVSAVFYTTLKKKK